jgi:hypothetical protein
MTGPDLVREAAAELYGAAPHEFISRRGELAAQARAAGAAAAARQIAALRKPTQSAWVVNQLARGAPEAITELAGLGRELRAAQRSLDGAAIRDLSVRRRELVARLARQALAAAGQQAAPAGLRDEVSTTLAAALANPDVAASLEAGVLSRAARSDGFGATGPSLTVVSPSDGGDGGGGDRDRRKRAGTPKAARQLRSAPEKPARPGSGERDSGKESATRSGRAEPASGGSASTRSGGTRTSRAGAKSRRAAEPAHEPAPSPEERAAAQEREREDRHRQALAAAQEAADEAAQAASELTEAEQRLEQTVQELEERLADARHELAEVRPRARRARTRDRQAQVALDRAGA